MMLQATMPGVTSIKKSQSKFTHSSFRSWSVPIHR